MIFLGLEVGLAIVAKVVYDEVKMLLSPEAPVTHDIPTPEETPDPIKKKLERKAREKPGIRMYGQDSRGNFLTCQYDPRRKEYVHGFSAPPVGFVRVIVINDPVHGCRYHVYSVEMGERLPGLLDEDDW